MPGMPTSSANRSTAGPDGDGRSKLVAAPGRGVLGLLRALRETSNPGSRGPRESLEAVKAAPRPVAKTLLSAGRLSCARQESRSAGNR
jgi:hypothetical protein